MNTTKPAGPEASTGIDAQKAVAAGVAGTPRAESILKSLLENIKNGKSPSKEQLSLYTALQSIQEGSDKNAARALISTQLGEAEAAKIDNNKEVQSILSQTRQALDAVKKNADLKISGDLGPVVSQIFGYDAEFKETSDYDEFLDMLRATVKMAKSGKTAENAAKLTQRDWKDAGHDGQMLFDASELAEANAFYAHVLNGGLLVRAEQLSSNKTGRDLMVALLRVKDAEFIDGRAVRGVDYKPSSDPKAKGKSEIVEQEGKTDSVDILFSGPALPWSVPQVRSLLQDHAEEGKPVSNVRIESVYESVTGKKLDIKELAKHPEMALEFQRMLIEKINFLTMISKLNLSIRSPGAKLDGSTGLTTVLMGKFDEVANREATWLMQNMDKLPKDSKESPTGEIASLAGRVGLPILAGALTSGIVVASYEDREISNKATFDEIAKRYDKDKPLAALLHNIFLGKEYSLRFGENHQIKAYVESVQGQLATFDKVAKWNFSDAEIAKLPKEERAMYQSVQNQYNILLKSKIDPITARKILEGVLYQSIETDAGKHAKEGGWSFRLSPLFVGFAREGVSVDTKYAENSALAAEGGIRVSSLKPSELEKIGKYEYNEKTKEYTLTLADTASFDDLPAGVVVRTDASGKRVLVSEVPFGVQRTVSRNADNTKTDTGYTIVLGGKAVEMKVVDKVDASAVPVWTAMEVKEKRDLAKNLPDALFLLGHSKDRQVQELVSYLAKQDFVGARAYLENITIRFPNKEGKMETYATLKKSLLANWDKVESFTTYMYGNQASKSKQEFSQEFVDSKVRKPDVIRAEERLARQHGIGAGMPESSFKVEKGQKYVPVSTETSYSGQDKTMLCFATPLGGLHRVDTYDNNITISSKTATIDDAAAKSNIFDATLNATAETKGIRAQVKKLNDFLGTKGPVTLDQYKAYIVSGEVSKLGIPGLAETKPPVFFEARAMIQGNVCMNRVNGIVYPVLGFPGSLAQTVAAPVQLDSGSYEGDSLRTSTSTVGDMAAGINPIFGAIKFLNDKAPPPPKTPNGGISTQLQTTAGWIVPPTTGPINVTGTLTAPAPGITGSTLVAPGILGTTPVVAGTPVLVTAPVVASTPVLVTAPQVAAVASGSTIAGTVGPTATIGIVWAAVAIDRIENSGGAKDAPSRAADARIQTGTGFISTPTAGPRDSKDNQGSAYVPTTP